MKKILILGAGMVGRTMAIDLAKKHFITSADIDKEALDLLPDNDNINKVILDVADYTSMKKALKDTDLVISAVPGFLGMQTMMQVIEQRKNLVDISFMPENVMHLNSMAKANNVTAVIDCGIAPGMPNYITGFYNERMEIDMMEYMVGGLPKIRKFPFEYKAPFSPCDVLEEYTRPARFVENGRLVIKPAMSDPELVNFSNIGTLEAFNTDGLRSLIFTMKHIPNLKEKTLRYPGHIQLIKSLIATGFLSKVPVKVAGTNIKPFDFTSSILFKAWKLDPDEPEFTIMKVKITGNENGEKKQITYELYDEFDQKTRFTSMGRTTGFTATGTAEMILDNKFKEKGVFPPELVGRNQECFKFILNYLENRNILFKIEERKI
jgi:lysine 6-dehydrogenase